MLTHCPECKGELSTAANACPHCGAQVDHGRLAGAGGPPQQPISVPKKSHFIRNCLGCGCLLTILLGVAVVGMVRKLKGSIVSKEDAPAFASSIAPGVQVPSGYELKGGANVDIFGFKGKGVIAAPVGVDLAQSGQQPAKTAFAFGAFSGKNQPKEQIHEQVEKFLAQSGAGGGSGGSSQNKVVSQVEEDFPVGPGTDKVKGLHQVNESRDGKRTTLCIIILDNYENEFGYLVLAAAGPETDFDMEGFKSLLKSVHLPKKSEAPTTQPSSMPAEAASPAPPAPGDGK